jgi:hypothetical protein
MRRATIVGGVFGSALVLLAVAAGYRALEKDVPAAPPAVPITPSIAAAATGTLPVESYQGFLYGRITTTGGGTHEGRLRWGVGQEAFWGDYFNGAKRANPWLAHVPPERLPKERRPIEILGIEIAHRESQIDIGRQLMARFGEITRIEARGREVRATLKSGTVFDLDRFDASDFDDGVRVWDGRRGVVDLDSLQIRTIELLPTPPLAAPPKRLHGTVRTPQGNFTGFVGWNRQEYVGIDELDGRTAEGKLTLRFDTIRSIARHSRDSSLVTLLDGREIVLSGTSEVGDGNRGIYVDDRRFGRVMISWDAFERVDFSPGGSGPAYDDFPPGRPLTGTLTTGTGRRRADRLVYDLDESETTDTLDGQCRGVDYTIPFALIASIVPLEPDAGGAYRAKVSLHGGEELQLERSADVGQRHAGFLVFTGGQERPDYVRWEELQRIDFDQPPATATPLR